MADSGFASSSLSAAPSEAALRSMKTPPPAFTISAIAPTSVASTGSPEAAASNAAIENDS